MYGMVLGGAWLLSVSETAIEVLHHPSEIFEFDSVVKLVQQYGTPVNRSWRNSMPTRRTTR